MSGVSLNHLPRYIVPFWQELVEHETDHSTQNISAVSSQITGINGHFDKGANLGTIFRTSARLRFHALQVGASRRSAV